MMNKKKLRPMIDRRSLEKMIQDERQFSKERSDAIFGSFKPLKEIHNDGKVVNKEQITNETGQNITVVTVVTDVAFKSSR
jgi:hypothetical protein